MAKEPYKVTKSPEELYNKGTDEEHPLKALTRASEHSIPVSAMERSEPTFRIAEDPLGQRGHQAPADQHRNISRVTSGEHSYLQTDEYIDPGGSSIPHSKVALYSDLQKYSPSLRFHTPHQHGQPVQGTMFSLLQPRSVGQVSTSSETTRPPSRGYMDEEGPSDEELTAIEAEQGSELGEQFAAIKTPARRPDTAHSVSMISVSSNVRNRGLSTHLLEQSQSLLKEHGVAVTADPYRTPLGVMAGFSASTKDPFAKTAPVGSRPGKYLTSETSKDVAHLGDFDAGHPNASGTPNLAQHVMDVLDRPGRALAGKEARNTARASRASRRNAGETERAKAFRASGHQGALFPGRLG